MNAVERSARPAASAAFRRGGFRRATGLALAALVLGLAGCGSGPRSVEQAEPDDAPYPAVGAGQARDVLDAVDASLERGAKEGTAAAYGDRVTGPYVDMALAQVRIDKARRRAPDATPATEVERLRLLVPSGQGWPRFFVAVGRAGGGAPVLRVLVSADARSPYALQSEVALLPGASVPAVSTSPARATALGAAAGGLVAPPGQVAERFAAFLAAGPSGKDAALFARNPFSDQVFARIAADRRELAKVATVSATHRADPERLVALRTADGGALVIATLRQSYTITVKKGAGTVRVDPDLAALAGKAQVGTSLTRTAAEVVAFSVPPAGKGQVRVIAATKGDVAASAR